MIPQTGADSRRALQIYLLGAPSVMTAGRELEIPRRRTRALLYRLAVDDQAIPRSQLAYLFWPDEPDARAHRNLSHLLTHLRDALPEPGLLHTADDQVSLDEERVWSDSACFAQLCARAEQRPPLTALEQAVDLYRGPLMAGVSLPGCAEFETWLVQEQRHFEQHYLNTLMNLVAGWENQGDVHRAIDYACRYLEVDALAEAMYRRLMELYARAGERTAALRQYEVCATVLERDLGVGPLPETRAVYQAVLEGKRFFPLTETKPTDEPALPSPDVPLVGRGQALDTLERRFARAEAGQGQSVFLSGEAGIGKSRLAQDFAAGLGKRACVLAASAYPAISKPPYQPLVEALRGALAGGFPAPDVTSQALARCPAVWLAEAARLLPELHELRPGLPAPLPGQPEELRARLFEALSQLVLGLASSRPTLLALDDLQWADSATLEWLAYFGQRIRNRPVMLLGIFRSEEAGAVSQLASSLQPTGTLSSVMLSGLDPECVLQILHHFILPQAGEEAFAKRLQQATGGNPFFLLETLSVLSERGRLQADLSALEDFPLPETVRTALDARLGVLSPRARQVLDAAAVMGDRFGFEWVQRTSGRTERETLDALEELVRRQLLVEDGLEYRFVHDLVRLAVEAGLSPIRCVLLHRRAARALERLAPQAAGTLAQHFEAGEDARSALRYYGLAARAAEASSGWQEAEAQYSRMLDLLEGLDPHCDQPPCLEQRVEVLVARTHLRYLQGRLAERDADLAALTGLAERNDLPALQLRVLIQHARYLNLDGRYAEAIALATRGLEYTARLEDAAGRSSCLAQIGFAHYFRGEYPQAVQALEAAIELNAADPSARGEISSMLSYACYLIADFPRALEYRQEALTARTRLGQRARVAEDLTDMGILHTRLNHLSEAERYLRQALALAREIGTQVAESYALNNIGNLDYIRGDYPAALECFSSSLALQRATGSRRGEASALGNMGMTLLALGDYPAAEQLQRQSLAIEEAIGYQSGLAEGLEHLARSLAGQGKLQEALESATRGLEIADRIGDRAAQTVALNVLAWLQLNLGEAPAAFAAAQRALDLAEQVQSAHGRIFALMLTGCVLLAEGDPAQALGFTTRAVDLLREQGCIEGPEESIYLAHHGVLQALGREEEAAAALSQARAEIDAKTGHIPDPQVRARYLASWPTDCLPRL